MNRNFVSTIIKTNIKIDCWIINVLRHSMKSIKSKNQRIRTYETNQISLSYFDDKTYIQNNGYNV